MKMSNRMGSELFRQLESDSRINEECRPKTMFQGILQRGQRLYEDRQYDVAIDIFRNIVPDSLTSQEKAVLNFNLGNCFFRKRDYKEAIAIYEQHFED